MVDDTTRRTRRRFLGSTAAAATVALAGCTGDGSDGSDGGGAAETTESMATETATESPTATPTPTEEPTTARPEAAPDVPIPNYALTLEHLENAFYRDGLKRFSDDELMEADALSEFAEEIRMELPAYLRTVGAHEQAHVEGLTATVEELNGDPVSEGEYEFGYETPTEFLSVAKALENTGVAAYKGAAPSVADDDVFAAAIGIHSVEARHAALLNEVDAASPFPDAVDEPKSMAEVEEVAARFVVEA